MMRLLPLLLLTVLGGCASLSVRVDVLDPVYVRENIMLAALRQDATRLAQGDTSQGRALVGKLRANYDDARRQVFADLRGAAAKTRAAATNVQAVDLLATRSPKLDQDRIDRFLADMAQLDSRAAALIRAQPSALHRETTAGPPVLDPALRDLMLSRQAAMTAFSLYVGEAIATLETDVRQVTALFVADAPAAAEQAKATLAAAAAQNRLETNRTILGGGTSLADRTEAYMATSKEADPYWAPRYNRAFGRGILGGTDVAIKMNGTADFAVKGFVFDARSTAQLIQKVGVRAVSLIAAAYGMPLTRTTPSEGTPARTAPDASKQIADSVATLATNRAEENAYRADLFRLADSVLANWDGTQLTQADRANIRAALQSRAARWKASGK